MQQRRGTAKKAGRAEAPNAAGVETGAARAQLARILASAAFDASERNRRFLRYVVEQTTNGCGDRIKAYDIAVTVFGRDESFDPQSDPIVRIEASRLRRSLERYYLLAGGDDPVRIEVPKGGYVATFRPRAGADGVADPVTPAASRQSIGGQEEPDRNKVPDTADALSVPCAEASAAPEPPPVPAGAGRRWFRRPARPPSARAVLLSVALVGALALGSLVSAVGGIWLGGSAPRSDGATQAEARRPGPAILVAPFEDDGSPRAHPGLSQGFTREIIAGLTRFSDLFVFGPETAFRHDGAVDPLGLAAELDVDFILAGGVSASSDRFQVTASLIDPGTGQHVWSGKLGGSLEAAEIIKTRDDLADRIVRQLAQPYGVIFDKKAMEIQGKPPQSFTSYECVLHFYHYWRTYRADLYGSAHDCLERAIVADPDYADAFSSLALVYADAYRFNFGQATIGADPLSRALELARRAVDLAPHSSHSYQALHLVHWLMNDVERSFAAAERGLALNPNDTELMADLGLRYSMRTDWDRGLPLVRQAFARNPAQPGHYRIALFLHHYLNGRYEEALAEARKIETRSIIYGHTALAIAYGQLGQTKEAAAAVAEMLAIDPAYGEHAIADLEKRNLHPDLIRAVVDGLEKAGLPVDRSQAS